MFSGLITGGVFGLILQRTQFCFVSGFRSSLFQHNLKFLATLFLAITIQSIGFFTLSSQQLITIPEGNLPIMATLLGSFIFGVGMVLAGCCACGAWFRSGEGAVSPFLVLLIFSLTMASCHNGSLKWKISALTRKVTNIGNFHDWLSISPWTLVIILSIITAILIYFSLKQKRFIPIPSHYKRKNISHLIFEKRFHPFLGATLMGILGIIAWYLSAENGREYGYGIAVPSANIIEYLVTGQQRYLNWGSTFVIGIFIGSLVSSLMSGEFNFSAPPPKEMPRRIMGGFLMGVGASLTGGCTVTNTLVATAYFSVQGWLATLIIILGFFIASLIFKPTQCKI